MRTGKERYRAVEVANPNLGGASVEIENAFFVDLGSGIRRRNNFNTNIRGAPEDSGILCYFRSVRCEPGDVNGLDAGGSGNRALGQGFTIGEERVQKAYKMALATRMLESRGRTHEDVAMLIGLDAIGELRQHRIIQNLGPTNQVERGLRIQVR